MYLMREAIKGVIRVHQESIKRHPEAINLSFKIIQRQSISHSKASRGNQGSFAAKSVLLELAEAIIAQVEDDE